MANAARRLLMPDNRTVGWFEPTQAADATQPDWTLATQWLAQASDKAGLIDTSVIQPTVLAATHYFLRAFAVDASGNVAAASTIDGGIRFHFDDDPLLPGTAVKSKHFAQLLAAFNAMARDCNYPTLYWNLDPGERIYASTLYEIYWRINAVRQMAGAPPHVSSYDAWSNTLIRATQIQSVRDAMR